MDSNQRIPKYTPNIQSYDNDLEKDEEELEEILIRMEREEDPTPIIEPKLGCYARAISMIDKHMPFVCLVAITLQMTFIFLFLRYSKIDVKDNYIPSVSVVVVEFIKIFICFVVSAIELRGKLFSTIFAGGFTHVLKMAIPALLYAIQNNITHYSLSRIEVPHFQIIYQFRIILTALFSMVLLNKTYTKVKWISMFSLFVGIVFAQVDSYVFAEKATLIKTVTIVGNDPNSTIKGNFFILFRKFIPSYFQGVIGTLIGALMSALAGVYTEKMLKESTSSLWITNIQLCSLSMFISILMCIGFDSAIIQEKGVFYGWEYIIIILVINQALGGLLVAAALYFADSVAKAYAGSVTLVLISILNVFLFDVPIHSLFIAGAIIVILATYYYSLPDGSVMCFGRVNRAKN